MHIYDNKLCNAQIISNKNFIKFVTVNTHT